MKKLLLGLCILGSQIGASGELTMFNYTQKPLKGAFVYVGMVGSGITAPTSFFNIKKAEGEASVTNVEIPGMSLSGKSRYLFVTDELGIDQANFSRKFPTLANVNNDLHTAIIQIGKMGSEDRAKKSKVYIIENNLPPKFGETSQIKLSITDSFGTASIYGSQNGVRESSL